MFIPQVMRAITGVRRRLPGDAGANRAQAIARDHARTAHALEAPHATSWPPDRAKACYRSPVVP